MQPVIFPRFPRRAWISGLGATLAMGAMGARPDTTFAVHALVIVAAACGFVSVVRPQVQITGDADHLLVARAPDGLRLRFERAELRELRCTASRLILDTTDGEVDLLPWPERRSLPADIERGRELADRFELPFVDERDLPPGGLPRARALRHRRW